MPLITILIFGILAGCFALLLELIALNTPFIASPTIISFFDFTTIFSFRAFGTLLFVALIEEISKFIFLFQYKKHIRHKDNFTLPYSIILATLFGIGFSSLEIMFSWQDIATFHFFPIFQTMLLHISTSFLFVYFIFSQPKPDDARQPETRKILTLKPFLALLGATLLHLAYNTLLLLTA